MKRTTRRSKNEQKDLATILERVDEELSQSEKPVEDDTLLKSAIIPREEEKDVLPVKIENAETENPIDTPQVEGESTEELPVPNSTPEQEVPEKKATLDELLPESENLLEFLDKGFKTKSEMQYFKGCPVRHDTRLIIAYDEKARSELQQMMYETAFIASGLVVLIFGGARLIGMMSRRLFARK